MLLDNVVIDGTYHILAEMILWCVVVQGMLCTTCLVPIMALTLRRQAHSHPASATPVVPDLVVESACVHMYTHYVYIFPRL